MLEDGEAELLAVRAEVRRLESERDEHDASLKSVEAEKGALEGQRDDIQAEVSLTVRRCDLVSLNLPCHGCRPMLSRHSCRRRGKRSCP